MNKIYKAFENKKALILFIVGGDSSLALTQKLLLEIQEAGADLIEIGIPFSDPIAEGTVIREADERALSGGCTTDKLFDAVEEIREQIHVPLVAMTYINPIYTYGKERFMKRCAECGITGVSVPDMPFEEKEELAGVCREYEVEMVSMITPASEKRIKKIAENAEGFLFGAAPIEETEEMIRIVRGVTNVPCVIGCEEPTPEQVKEISRITDGIIIDSAIVNIVAEHQEACVPYVGEYVRQMKEALN